MKLIFQVCTIIFIGLITTGITNAQNKDVKGSSDYPLISRMPDFWIASYQESEYESYTFRDEANKKIDIEGHKYFIEYRLNTGAQEPGPLMILKNHENALKKINAEILSTTKKDLYCKVTKEGKEIWIQVHALDRLYRLTIVEREQMEQKVVVNPDALFGDIESTGHAAVYGIYFDHGSAKIKQESKPSLKAIADMLKANKSLKLYVVGHTDMTGGFEYNVGLSLERANAVVKALVNDYSIAAERLTGKGAGPICPIGSNKNDDGRKLNRRVELVEM